MKKLGIIIAMTVAVAAYKDGRRTLSPLEDFPPYQGPRQYPSFHEQHQPFREQGPFKAQQYQSYRQRPYRQDLSSFPERLSFRDQSLLRDYSLTKNRPFYVDNSSFRDVPDSKGQASFFIDGASFRDQRFREPTFRNEQSFQDQSLDDQYSFQQQSFADNYRFPDSYDKQINSYNEQKQAGQQQFGRDSEYLKHGNHGLGYVSMPPISSYGNPLPLNEEMSTTIAPSTASPITQPLQQSTVSSAVQDNTKHHTSATSQPKMALHGATIPGKSDTLADGSATSPPPTVSTAPASSVISKQSSNLAHPPTVLPTVASLPVMATESPIISFGRQTLSPVDFPSTKFTVPSSYYVTGGLKNKLQQSLLNYLLTQQAKSAIKSNEESSVVNYALPDVSNNSLNKIHSTVSNYVLPEESKDALKDNLRSSLLSYLLQPQSNRALSFQQSSLPETVNYVPLGNALVERPKLSIPSIPIGTLSGVSRPLQTVNYVPTMPRVSAFVTQDSLSSSALPLGATLASGLAPSVSDSQSTSIFNSLPGGLNGISASMPGSLLSGVPTSIPTLNLAQNFQHFGQLRPFEAARSQPLSYATGLQMQLGGYGGIDYALRPSNLAPRPLELGIAKVGLSLPELQRHQLPTFSKVGLEQQLW
ncbi:uncharacterized protein LOC122396948 [Colletes gigas]|uniref:uncharacterized protein LOC122396948 n=1 Tax=Colletes gigas TaxID=935657 RepID=UPI001C9B4C38|nr:uncharacterized protein LOC122396948 [Colletes gigas]